MRRILTTALLMASAAAAPEPGHAQAPDSAAVVAAVDAYHAALESGDTAAVRSLLTDDAIVQEGGGIETRTEYFSHHLSADMAFAAAAPGERSVERVTVRGDVAWVASSSERSGTYRDRAIDMRGAELMVLRRVDGKWRIAVIHWSSRAPGVNGECLGTRRDAPRGPSGRSTSASGPDG